MRTHVDSLQCISSSRSLGPLSFLLLWLRFGWHLVLCLLVGLLKVISESGLFCASVDFTSPLTQGPQDLYTVEVTDVFVANFD